MELFNRFDVHHGTTHADLLTVNALSVAARRMLEIEVVKLDDTTISVMLPSGRRIVASDWDNIRSALTGA